MGKGVYLKSWAPCSTGASPLSGILQSPLQVLSVQSLPTGPPLPPPQGLGCMSLPSTSPSFGSCLFKSLFSQENHYSCTSLELPTSLSFLSNPSFSKGESILDAQSPLFFWTRFAHIRASSKYALCAYNPYDSHTTATLPAL